ncbi:MAG: glycosyltransferase family 2 protein [Alphaproteobacteria bacterium]
MTKVSVVIPFYQRQPGLLRRALQSVFAQDLDGDVEVDVIVVNDQSPISPAPEAEGLARENYRLRIIERPNGGPAMARNTGLDAAAGSDFIAFLDSDDWWEARHLTQGIAALRDGAQLYFANHSIEGAVLGFYYAPLMPAVLARSTACAGDARQVASDVLMERFVEEQAAHLSAVLLDAHALGDLRYDERRKMTGEDYLYLLAAIARSERVAFSLAPTAVRGRGIDFYRGAYGWDNPDTIRRLYSDLRVFTTVRKIYCRTAGEKKLTDGKIDARRLEILFLLLRNAAAHAKTNAEIAGGLVRHDPGFWLMLPRNLFTIFSKKLRGEVFEAERIEIIAVGAQEEQLAKLRALLAQTDAKLAAYVAEEEAALLAWFRGETEPAKALMESWRPALESRHAHQAT